MVKMVDFISEYKLEKRLQRGIYIVECCYIKATVFEM